MCPPGSRRTCGTSAERTRSGPRSPTRSRSARRRGRARRARSGRRGRRSGRSPTRAGRAAPPRRTSASPRTAGSRRQVDAVAEHVRGTADLGLTAHEALDLEPPRGKWHRAVENGQLGRRRLSSPARASTARRLNATTTVPCRRLWKETSPVQSSGALRSKKRTSAAGRRSGSGAAPRPRRAAGCGGTRRRGAGASRPSPARCRQTTAPRRARAPRRKAAPSRPYSR